MNIEEKRKRQSEYQKSHYQKKKQYYKDKAKVRRDKVRQEFDDFKSELSCEKCGENHIAALDFHHINPKEKEMAISKAASRGWGVEKMKSEIDKCQVLCANCHRKLHYEEKNAIIA